MREWLGSLIGGERMVNKLLAIVAAVALSGPMVRAAEPIPFRGVVEGYYGRPWGTEGRLSLLKFMGENDMNVFIYGPKDDPYHHYKWSEPYPEAELADFRKLLAVAKENKISFYWAIHLGDSFKKPEKRDQDYEKLFRKLNWMYEAGFRAFAAFFDDFGGSNADLHAELCNRIVTDFLEKKQDCSPLIMCPNVYWGTGHPYQKTLGAKLDKRVNIMWTGRWICHDINAEDVEKITADFQRPPYIWWNWPVNDFCRAKVLLGRTYGLDACKYAGFVSNPMENLEASKPALFSVADFAWNMKDFDSKRTWNDAFLELYPSCPAAMRCFADHNSDAAGGPRSKEGWLAGWNRLESENFAANGDLGLECEAIRGACRKLTDTLPTADPALWSEIRNWVAMLDAQAQEGQAALRKDKASYDAAKKLRAEIFERQKDYFTSLAPEWDKKNCTGAITGTRLLQPAIDAAAAAAFAK